jgi:hypothetical protein
VSDTAEMSADICGLIVRQIPPLRGDRRVLAQLEASVGENVATMLHIIQHGTELENCPRTRSGRSLRRADSLLSPTSAA